MGLTIRDIARIANVSRSTVSLALNDSPRINPETKKRVLEIVQRLDYHPNAMARALVEKRSRVLALLVPQIDHVFSDSYFSETVSGITDVIYGRGYSLTLEVTTQRFIDDAVYERLFQERRIDGMLIVGSLTTDEWISRLRDRGRPICLVNSVWEGVSSLVADNRAGAERVVDHLVGLGHREIGYIKGLDITTVGQQRDEGFRAALERHGPKYDEDLVAYGNFSEQSGHEAMKELLGRSRRPTAVFTTNDMMALGSVRAIRDHGLRVPEDVAIVGGDDIPLAHYVTPALTTIRQPMDEIGSLAVGTLISRLEVDDGKTPEPLAPFHRVVDTDLVVRESCGAKR
jgi:DNA-binding LacI/PurR family transcriptional regulator